MAPVPSGRWEASFAPEPDSARRARLVVEAGLSSEGVHPNAIAGALLVLNEIVSNAIRHARTDFTVCAEVKGAAIRLEVRDYDTRPPALLNLDEESTSGRGLHMVSGIASDWGWKMAKGGGESGKVVWAEVPLDAAGHHDERGR